MASGCPDGYPDGLPDLPADWGPIVIPDDAATLAEEAALVRRELAQRPRRDHRHWSGAPQVPRASALRLLLVVLSVAVLATLGGLVSAVWPTTQQRPASPQRGAGGGTPAEVVPALDLTDEYGRPVAIRSLLPAVIVFVDGCECDDPLRAVAGSTPPGVTVVAVNSEKLVSAPVPAVAGPGTAIRSLADPTAELRTALLPGGPSPQAPAAGEPTRRRPPAALVARSGQVLRLIPDAAEVAVYRAELAALAAT